MDHFTIRLIVKPQYEWGFLLIFWINCFPMGARCCDDGWFYLKELQPIQDRLNIVDTSKEDEVAEELALQIKQTDFKSATHIS